MAQLGTKVGTEGESWTIHTPLIHLNKAETIQAGLRHGVDYSLTVSCYQADADGQACGHCHSCHFRKKGFEALGIPDPTHYSIHR
jgi:7-cyano-7-deazaguanine synthase